MKQKDNPPGKLEHRLFSRKRVPVILQSEIAECGLACVGMVASFYGRHISLHQLRSDFGFSTKGANLQSLLYVAASVELGARTVQCSIEELARIKTPAILHWKMNHFVVLARVYKKSYLINDPALGEMRLTEEELSRFFTGIAIELYPSEGFTKKSREKSLRIRDIIRPSLSIRRGIVQAIALSVLVEVFSLVMPIYGQTIIDHVIPNEEVLLLNAVAIGFFAVVIFQAVSSALRGLTLQFISSVLNVDLQARTFNHLLGLPLSWFQKRQVGDIQSRFQSLQPIQRFLSHTLIEVCLDSVTSLALLGLMFMYSPHLAGIAVASVFFYFAIRLLTFSFAHRATGEQLAASADMQTLFLETVRGIETFKFSAAEQSRQSSMWNAFVSSANASVKIGNINILYRAFNSSIIGASDILILYIGALSVISSNITLGMLMAFTAYKVQFSTRMSKLVEQVIEWRLLDVQLERLADIVRSAKEPHIDDYSERAITGAIICQNVSFRYSDRDSMILKNVNISINEGEYVAIVGPSGSGKSTFVKILAGLYSPSEGEIYYDGFALSMFPPRVLRQQIAVVSQNDTLLKGTIAQNIAGFADNIDIERVHEAARAASIEQDILGMPMNYNSLVGDMGAALSGGQKQRIMIARALYKQPKVLIFDEATSHLDLENEDRVNQELTKLNVTRIVVAHRKETINSVDRVIDLGQINRQQRQSLGAIEGGIGAT